MLVMLLQTLNFLNNEQMQFQLTLVNQYGMDILPTGLYTTLTETLNLAGTQLYIYAEGQAVTFADGRATVTVEENIYTFDIYLVEAFEQTLYDVSEFTYAIYLDLFLPLGHQARRLLNCAISAR